MQPGHAYCPWGATLRCVACAGGGVLARKVGAKVRDMRAGPAGAKTGYLETVG